MYIESVSNRNFPPAVLLRESYRLGGKVKKRTLANLSKWPPALVEGLRTLLKRGTAVARFDDAFDIVRACPHGHLTEGALVLYDLTSVYLEGRKCPLAKRGHSRDGKRGKLQIEFGLPCDAGGCPVAVEVFAGNTADPMTVGSQIEKLRQRFGLSRVVLVGDRGMLTEARIREEVKPAGLDWIGALRGPAIRKLVGSGAVQMSLFDEQDLVEVRSDAYPGERLMVCRNPLLGAQRARKREERLEATEELLQPIGAATRRKQRRLKDAEKIGERVGKVIGQYKMAKHCDWSIDEQGFFAFRRDAESIAEEATLDGLYVIRTSLRQDEMNAADTVRAYKRLSAVERALRSLKGVDLKVRPVFHRTAERVRAHYVEWQLRRRLAPLLFDDDDRSGRRRGRPHFRRGPGTGVGIRPAKGPAQAHRRRATRAQLPHPARRPGHRDEKPRRAQTARRRTVRSPCPAHRTATRSLPGARRAATVANPVTNR